MAPLLHRDLEDRFFAGHVGVAVIIGKGDAHLTGFTGADTLQLVVEAGEQSLGAELDLPAFAAAAGYLLVADAAQDIGNENIALLGRPLDRLRFALPLGHSFD